MGELADNMSSQVIDSLSKSFIQTGSMKKIVMLDWPTDQKGYFVQMSDTLEISQDELNSLLKKEKDCKYNSRPVVVELLNLSWFFAGKKKFHRLLDDSKLDAHRVLLDQANRPYARYILAWCAEKNDKEIGHSLRYVLFDHSVILP